MPLFSCRFSLNEHSAGNASKEAALSHHVVYVSGHLDSSTSDDFLVKARAFFADHPANFILDCCDLRYVSSAGLRVFALLAQSLAAEGHRLFVRHPQPMVAEVLRISGFDRLLPELDASA